MGQKIRIESGKVDLIVELNDRETAKAIAEACPLESEALRWGEEVYFSIPVRRDLEAGSCAEVAVGDVGYWPNGPAVCVFFGATPASRGDHKPRAASPVTIIGKVIGDAAPLAKTRDGDQITLRAGQ